MIRTLCRCLALVAALACAATNVHAQISGLYNTGVDNAGVPFPDLSQDVHYTLISSADANCPTTLPPRVNTRSGIAWLDFNNGSSQWIRPEQIFPGFPPNDAYGICGNGRYIYRTTFTATGNPSLVSIQGNLAADDNGTFVDLNSGGFVANPNGGFGPNYTPFSITSGFVTGLNTLDFHVDNLGGAPTGLRVEFVPEPSSAILAALSVAALGLFQARRRRERRKLAE